MNTSISNDLFEKAERVIPGGVNSPVRAFGPVGGKPIFIERANKQYLYDVDGNCYIDYIGSWGPMVLGHNDERVIAEVKKQLEKGLSYGAATRIEVEMAEMITNLVPAVEMIRMVNSGTEAVMSAIRLARGYTRRDKIVKFEGCYHGHADAMLVKAGSGVMTSGIPDSLGVAQGCAQDTLTATYNDLQSVETLFATYKDQIACIIVEPVAANMGVVLPEEDFLSGLRKICDKNGALLIFDEVITGFRLGISGASEYFHVLPDLVTYGKIIGGGMPVGAYGGKKQIMEMVAPIGSVYQAGTLSGNPIAMQAGFTQLNILKNTPEIYNQMNQLGDYLRTGIQRIIKQYELPCTVNGIGSLSCLFFTKEKVRDYKTAKTSDTEAFAKYFKWMLEKGHYLGPSQFEAIFISAAHTKDNIEKMLYDMEQYFKELPKV